MEISVSYLKSKYSTAETINKISETDADYLHVDLMDGGFVPTKNFIMEDILATLSNVSKPLDIHLMCFDPIIYIEKLALLKPAYITFHLEATKDIVKTIELIKRNNIKVGLSLRPDTDILELMPYLSLVDLVLIMSVNPGMGGQSFIPASTKRLQELLKIRNNNNLNFKIEMDGGINAETIQLVKNLDIAVSGSFVCESIDFQEQINRLKY